MKTLQGTLVSNAVGESPQELRPARSAAKSAGIALLEKGLTESYTAAGQRLPVRIRRTIGPIARAGFYLCVALLVSHPGWPAPLAKQSTLDHPSGAAHGAGTSGQAGSGVQSATYAEAMQSPDQLVSVTGIVVNQAEGPDAALLCFRVDGRLVYAALRPKAVLANLKAGSTVRVTGMSRPLFRIASPGSGLLFLDVVRDKDVVLLAGPSWYTVGHGLEVLAGSLILGLGIAAWLILLRWRARHEKAWMERATTIAQERTRILEIISSNRTLDELLTEICKSGMELLPGTTCAYKLGRELAAGAAEMPPLHPHRRLLHEVTLHDDRGEVNGIVVVRAEESLVLRADRAEVFSFISELSSLSMRQFLLYRGLVHHSTHDPLTELPNRRLCESHLDTVLKEAEESGGRLAVIYIDINRFKYVNDMYGHKTGDLYLQQISARLRAQLRSIDMLARVGGDEFVVIAPFPEYFDRAYAISARLRACFQDPFSLDGALVDGSASFGIARYPEHGLTAEELTRHADHEMYIAKHETHISEEAHGLAIITVSELELALLNGSFRLAYQPQFSAAGKLTGLEALLRLDDPVLGLLTPDAFISIAEQNRVIVDIGTWALRCALRDVSRWGLNRGEPISLAVNVSVRQLEEPGYAKSVLAFLKEYSFPPNQLEIELIERSLMFSGDKVLQELEVLRSAGVRITLDDFGTEQSCLSMLHKLPIDTIKLDRSFIRVMDTEPKVLPIIQAIVSMAQSLGKRIVAEAIEHVGPVPALMKMGKMDFQGYLLSRPVAAEEMQLVIGTWRSGIVMPDAFREGNPDEPARTAKKISAGD